MDENGNLYAAPEDEVPERDKDRLVELGRQLMADDEREFGPVSRSARLRARAAAEKAEEDLDVIESLMQEVPEQPSLADRVRARRAQIERESLRHRCP